MGADDRGKQELPVELLRRSRLFADLVSQSTTMGEFQHVATEIASGGVHLDALGDVATGKNPGRPALQDIFLAETIPARPGYLFPHGCRDRWPGRAGP
jgi:ornithine cyclodeaminase